MASLSLPRVLQLKKNSLDAEREQFEKYQTLAIQKAINSIETPVKEKHVRSTIIGTFQEQSAITYWMVAVRLPLQDNRIVAWKFCHVTHKLLREGHPACLDDSQRHIGMIENLGKLWVHLREGYGRLVSLYCTLLVVKLKFHARNPRFPGNMQLTADELDNIAENDVNNYFQLCVELFDYMDEILNLQAAVFDSLGNARANSMTASGQCRLAALIPCAQDSSHIYDCNVRLLFRLHAALPADTLAGHRERFRQQFKKLSSFYKHASSLQYYRNLLSLPVLPANPPNFLLQSDFGTYVTPVVSIPEPPPDELDAVGSLIDTSDTVSQISSPDTFDTRTTPSPQPDPVVERDRLIDHLQSELKRMRAEVSQLVQERNSMLGSIREHCTRLETELQAAKTELEEERQKAELLSSQTPEIQQQLSETQEKAKVTDEKFQKLKGAYTQLREEHIALIRQKAEVDKTAASLRAAAAQHESAKTALQQQLNDRMKDVELLQQSASSSEEIEAYKSELANLRTDLEQARQKELELETLRASMEALEIEHKTATTEQHEQITIVTNELKEVTENLEKLKQENEEKESVLNKFREELTGLREKSGDEYKKVVEEKETALKQLAELTQQYQQEKQDHDRSVSELQVELKMSEIKLTDLTSNFEAQCDKLKEELTAKTHELDDTIHSKDEKVKETMDELTQLQLRFDAIKNSYEANIQEKDSRIAVLEQIITGKSETLEELTKKNEEAHTINENQKTEFGELLIAKGLEIKLLNEKINTLTKDQDESIKKLESVIASKDDNIVSLTSEAKKFEVEVTKLEKELKDTRLELENEKGKIMSLNKEYDTAVISHEENLAAKDQEIKSLKEEIDKLSRENNETIDEKDKIISDVTSHEEVYQKEVVDLTNRLKSTSNDYEHIIKVKSEDIGALNAEIEKLKADLEQLILNKGDEIEKLNNKIREQDNNYIQKIALNEDTISEMTSKVSELNIRIDESEIFMKQEREDFDKMMSAKDTEIQMIEARLEHTERKRLNAECELQDLLQHNSILEADLAAARRQVEDAKKLIEQQTSKLVSCASASALEVTAAALAALDRSNAQETNKLAAETAAKALEELAAATEVKGNEESVARSAVAAAHNAATLSAYVTEVCNVSTDLELSDKLSNECRTMLASTKQCLEALRAGDPPSLCADARAQVQSVARAAAAADRQSGGARSVDDELADMDKAIEQAASQIEEMLAASRAGDSGVKLEVNGKILDACTTLMGAVKILVQDARKLQNELGDPKTRMKMYRRNPQWSEGLISAAKAVVFAAKLLVTSADEAVGASGRVEGVSAAAHEVAGSTAQLVAASRARAPPASPALARLTSASRSVAAATGAVVAAVRAGSALVNEQEALDTSALTLTATRRLEMESKVRSLELECALDAERARLAALRKRHYHLAQQEENGNMTNGKQ